MEMNARWELKPGQTYHWTLGVLSVWICRVDGEWLYAWNHRDEDAEPPVDRLSLVPDTPKPDDLPWTRVIAPDADHGVGFAPRLADRAVVIKGDEYITVLPRSNAELFAPLPVWVAVFSGASPERVLFEAPTQPLHRRWFGNSMQGSLCYSVFARLTSDRVELELPPVSALCTIRIRNQSSVPFRTDSVFLQANEFKLYRRRDADNPFAGLVSSSEVITVTGDNELSFSVASERAKQQQRAEVELVADWRKRPDDSWWKRGYVLFQRISNY